MNKARARDRFWILLLVGAILCVQTAPLVCGHSHSHSPAQCCWLCHASAQAFLQPAAASPAPASSMVWLERPADLGAPPAAYVAAGSSRAPPA
jgi:hypothetical protein